MILNKVFAFLMLFMICGACDDQSNNELLVEDRALEQNGVENEETVEGTSLLSSFFLENGSIAKYLGKGNEFASYTAMTQWHDDKHVSIYEDNGGTIVLRTYRIDDDSIELIQEQGEFYGTYQPTSQELKSLPEISTLLDLPLTKGNTFDAWTIIEINQKLATPYKVFDDVMVLEMTSQGGAIIQKFFAEGFGEVKREFIMKDGKNEFIVSSTLESIK
jgi:hypothetical protein